MTKQNSFTKKVFSLLLSLAMVLTMMPAAAFADGETSTVENAVAEVTIGDVTTQYIDINGAFTAAKDSEGSTVTLLENVTTTSAIVVASGTFTIDLNGKRWERSSGYTLWVKEEGNVTVTSSNGTGTISNTGGGTAIYVDTDATVHVTDGVRLSRLFAAKDATLTLDVGVIITETLYANTDNIAPFLTGKALQVCDGNDKPIDGQYVSIYEKYNTNAKETGCVIVIEHTRCEGTPSEGNPCPICGYDGTQTKPTEPEDDPDVAEVNGTKYKTLAEAIAAANGAEITLLEVFGENVVVSDESSKASIILGTGGTIVDGGKEYTYPSYWIAASRGIPLTMDAGEITLKSGVLAQFCTGAGNDIAIKLNGGTLTVADTVTKIIGGSVASTDQNTAQMAAIEAIGGTLDLQGNTHLDGGLIMRDGAKLQNKLTAGTFTNSGSTTASVSVKGDTTSYPPVSDSTEYKTVFDLLAEGYAFAKYDKDTDKAGDVIAKDATTKELMQDVTVIKCEHKDANNPSLFKDGTCKGCGFVCEHKNPASEESYLNEDGKCTACGTQMPAKVSGSFYSTLAAAIEAAKNNGTVTVLADVEEDITIADGTDVTIDLNGKTWKGLTWHAAVPLTVSGGSVTLQNGKLEQGGASSYANTAVVVNGGSLTVGDGMTIRGSWDSSIYYPAIDLQSGNLTLSVGTKLYGGMKVVEGKTLADYLPTGTAFVQIPDGGAGSFVNGYVQELTGNFTLHVEEHTHYFVGADSKCACGAVCEHKGTINDNGTCTVCKVHLYAAKDNSGSYYLSADDAFLNAADGSTVTLLEDSELDNSLFVNPDTGYGIDKTVTLCMNGKKLSQPSNTPALVVASGKLIIEDEATISHDYEKVQNAQAALSVLGGTLVLKQKATITGGLKVWSYEDADGIKRFGTLEGGLPLGTIITRNGDGGSYFSVSVEGSSKYTSVLELLGEGLAFAAYDTGNSSVGEIVNGNVAKLTQDVIVVEHKTHDYTDGVCACGVTCAHSSFTNGKCDICGYECTHPSDKVSESSGTATCGICNAQMVVKVTNGDTTTYYAEHFESNGDTEDTLKQVFKNAEDGSTVTLLADGLYASAEVTGKNITLNLNGKNLIENNGFAVESKNGTAGKLIVTGSGSSTTPEGASLGICTFRVWNGELLFDDNFSGRYGTIYVHGGTLTSVNESQSAIHIGTLDITNSGATVSLKGGTFGTITCSGSVTLGDLLAKENPIQRSGKAFKYTTGDKAFVPYDTTITSDSPVTNVTIVDCPHNNITDGKDTDGSTYGVCSICGMDNIAAVLTKPDGSIETYTINNGTGEIFNGLKNNGGTLKLYRDLTCNETLGTQDGTTEMVIDLNGHTISLPTGATGQEVMLNGGSLTITDSSSGKSGRFAATLRVYYTASLTVDGVAMGTIDLMNNTASITLKEGTTFTAIDADCLITEFLPAGCYIVDDSNNAVDLVQKSITSDTGFTVKQLPGTVTADKKKGEIRYGSNKIADELLPTVTMNDESKPQLKYEWYYNTDSGAKKLITITQSEDGTVYNMESGAWNNLSVGDKLDVFCIVSSETAGTPWKTPVTGYTLTVTAGNLAEASIDLTGSNNPVYTPDGYGSCYQQTLEFSVSHNGTILTEGTDYQIMNDSNHGYKAGKYTLVLEGLGKYAGSTLEYEWKIAKRELTGMTNLSKTYDGTADLPDNIAFNYGENKTVELKKGDDFTVTGGFDSADAGDRTVTATVKLTNPNYTFADGKTQQTFTIGNVSIQKAAAPKLTPVDITQKYNVTEPKTADASKAGMPQDAGTLSYEKGTDAAIKNVQSWGVDATTGVVTYTLTGGAVGDKITLPVKISSTNYKDATANIVITLTDKDVPTVTAEDLTVTYDGNPVPADKVTGTATFDGQAIKGTWSWKAGQEITNVAHSGEKTVVFTPEDTETYAVVEQNIRLTINKATPTGTPKYTAITKDGQTLADASLTAVDENKASLFQALGKALKGILKWVQSDDQTTELDENTKVEQGKAYTWLFTPADGDNYNTLTGTITLWRKSSGGGGGAVAPTPTTPNTDVVTEKDGQSGTTESGETAGATTKTTVKETKTETTKNEQGQTVSKTTASISRETAEELVRQATEHKSDTVEITVKSSTTAPSDGAGADTAADSVTSTELTIPKTTIEDIAKNTEADLVIKTDSGEVTLDNKTLETIAKEAKGDTVTITVNENTQLTEAQKPAAAILGKNGKLFDLAAKIGDKLIHHFDGGKAHVTLPMPDSLKGKDILVIYINDKGLCEILSHAVETVGADSYIKFTTPHFSTFAVVDRAEAEDLIKAQNETRVKELMKNAKFKVTTTRTSKKSVKVTVTPKNDKELISDIKAMGYTVKYQFYRSTKKTSGYKLLKTKATNSYINTKGTKGRKYYYKARVLVYDGKTLIAKTALKQASYGARTWTK